MAVYRPRMKAIWDYLALPVADRAGPLPWAACPPPIWDPAGVLSGEHRDGWAYAHWAFDFYPAPAGGLQHRVNISDHRFVGHARQLRCCRKHLLKGNLHAVLPAYAR